MNERKFYEVLQKSDLDRNGSMSYPEFVFFISLYFGEPSPFSEEQIVLLFAGMDATGAGEVTCDKVEKLVRILCENNLIEINKYYFRGLDSDRDCKITKDCIAKIASVNGVIVKQSKLARLSNLISFSQCMELLFNIRTEELTPETELDNNSDDFSEDQNEQKGASGFLLLGLTFIVVTGVSCYFAFGRHSNKK